MRTSSGPSSGDQGRACARCHSTIHASAAAFTSWRHGLTFFDDSIIRPPPTWRLLPCGAGDPWTVSVTVTDGLWGASASTALRSEEHTSELQSLMRISYAVFCLKKKKKSLIPHIKKAYIHE